MIYIIYIYIYVYTYWFQKQMHTPQLKFPMYIQRYPKSLKETPSNHREILNSEKSSWSFSSARPWINHNLCCAIAAEKNCRAAVFGGSNQKWVKTSMEFRIYQNYHSSQSVAVQIYHFYPVLICKNCGNLKTSLLVWLNDVNVKGLGSIH